MKRPEDRTVPGSAAPTCSQGAPLSNELGQFPARRADAALEPTSGTTGRRRITGLRREEVAAFAGISVDYVTRLEQGRETNPSNAVLDALARVLRLGPDAVDHLYALRGKDSAGGRPRPRQGAAIATRMDDLVEAVRPHPAYVLDRLSTMVAGNDEGLTLFAGIAELPAEERNTCRYLLTHPRAQEGLPRLGGRRSRGRRPPAGRERPRSRPPGRAATAGQRCRGRAAISAELAGWSPRRASPIGHAAHPDRCRRADPPLRGPAPS